MRVHRLEVTAFGPFGGTESIDFDALNEAGIFLLTGPTGAGKTSILDAICFALFGAVPGARNNAKDLKSHHADSQLVPVVELEVTLRDRRFRLRRSPAWRRPSSRARSGYVDENARATVAELVNGAWEPLSNRLDDVGLLVTRVLGMNRDQFCQVVMLPQGQFQTFLRAGAKERRDVLESLFETGRFGRIEKWLGDHRRRCEKACVDQEAELRQLLSRVSEVHGGDLVDETEVAESAALHLDRSRTALGEAIARLELALVETRLSEAATLEVAKTALHSHDEAKALGARQLAHADATLTLQALDSLAEITQQRRALVDRARDARALGDLVDLVDVATRRLASATADARATFGRCDSQDPSPTSFSDLTPAAVETEVQRQRSRVQRADALAEVEQSLCAAEAVVAAADTALSELRDELRVIAGELVELPSTIDRAQADLAEAVLASSRLPALTEHVAGVSHAHEAATRAADLVLKLARAADDARDAKDVQLKAREQWLDTRGRYLGNLAAVLAAELVDGRACPVCGSHAHPSPAAAASRQASAVDESLALDALSEAEQVTESSRRRVSSLDQQLAVALTTSCGLAPDETLTQLEALTHKLGETRSAARARPELVTTLARLTERDVTLGQRQVEAAAQVAAATARRTEASETAAGHRRTLDREVGVGIQLADHLAATKVLAASWEAVATGMRAAIEARSNLEELDQRLTSALGETDFDDADDVRDALLPDAEVARVDALNRAYDADHAVATRSVMDPHLVAAAGQPPPDLEGLSARVDMTSAEHRSAAAEVGRLARQLLRLEELAGQLESADNAGKPLREARDLAVEVAALCAGTSADNRYRTTLSNYVLGARLQQVVEAANVRLTGISGGRFQLQHSMERGVGDARGGLGLVVLDTYTGSGRDPATLSGGETFYVSLALALGLADLVRDEIGGPELSTLFVDEGFGGLDAETLDEVMDEIDTLRSGGRCVGLVSHLTELRLRVPTQLRVSASPRGSRVLAR